MNSVPENTTDRMVDILWSDISAFLEVFDRLKDIQDIEERKTILSEAAKKLLQNPLATAAVLAAGEILQTHQDMGNLMTVLGLEVEWLRLFDGFNGDFPGILQSMRP